MTALGAQVRKGEKATYGVKWIEAKGKDADGAIDPDAKSHLVPVGFAVSTPPRWTGGTPPRPTPPSSTPSKDLLTWFNRASVGSPTVGTRPTTRWVPTASSAKLATFDTEQRYFATRAHETVHATAHPSRNDRN